MHKLTNWTVRRSGAQVTVQGTNEAGERAKVTASRVDGPNEVTGVATATLLDATTVQLVGPPLSDDAKVRRVGSAVCQLERELIDEGKSHEAGKLVSAFAALPAASMATLYDILVS